MNALSIRKSNIPAGRCGKYKRFHDRHVQALRHTAGCCRTDPGQIQGCRILSANLR